jgi:hypothetical protein
MIGLFAWFLMMLAPQIAMAQQLSGSAPQADAPGSRMAMCMRAVGGMTDRTAKAR